jgi:hypothetical protein
MQESYIAVNADVLKTKKLELRDRNTSGGVMPHLSHLETNDLGEYSLLPCQTGITTIFNGITAALPNPLVPETVWLWLRVMSKASHS